MIPTQQYRKYVVLLRFYNLVIQSRYSGFGILIPIITYIPVTWSYVAEKRNRKKKMC